MSFPPATEMVQFAGFASSSYGFTEGYPLGGGLPHSEIRGSTGARPSPELFAACHVLHRLSVPRHPPDALVSLAPPPAPGAKPPPLPSPPPSRGAGRDGGRGGARSAPRGRRRGRRRHTPTHTCTGEGGDRF